MSRIQAWSLHVSVALMTISGIVFAWMKYFSKPVDEFAVINHPLQPQMLAAHVVLAPLMVFAIGWIFEDHILAKFAVRAAPLRKSGVFSMILIAPMVLSGYLLQIATADATRRAMAIAHWVSSALFVIGYAGHLLTRTSIRR